MCSSYATSLGISSSSNVDADVGVEATVEAVAAAAAATGIEDASIPALDSKKERRAKIVSSVL